MRCYQCGNFYWHNDSHPVYADLGCWSTVQLVFGSSTIDVSTRDSSIIFALQLLIASHKQLRGGSGGQSPQF